MLEAVWEKASNKVIAKAQIKAQPSAVRFEDSLSRHDQKQYQNQFDKAPDSAFGKQYNMLNMGDHGLKALQSQLQKGHPNKALFLSHNNISDKGLHLLSQQLKNDQQVQHLILSHNNIQLSEFAKAAVMDMLKVNHHIGWLVFGYNQINDEGLKNLAKALKKNKGVRHLVLTENDFSDDGFAYLCEQIAEHPSLESLFLAGNALTSRSLDLLRDLLSKNSTIKRLDIRGIQANEGDLRRFTSFCNSKGILIRS